MLNKDDDKWYNINSSKSTCGGEDRWKSSSSNRLSYPRVFVVGKGLEGCQKMSGGKVSITCLSYK